MIAGHILRGLQELTINFSTDHLELYANVVNLFDLAWDDIPQDTANDPHIGSAIMNDPLLPSGNSRALKVGLAYKF